MQLLYVIVFLVVLLIINSILSPVVVKELFADDSLPIKTLTICGRQLIFPYFGNNNIFTAAQRAVIDNRVTTSPAGKCVLPVVQGDLNESFAMVHENSVFYTLKKSCMALNILKYRFENNGDTLVCGFAINTPQNVENLARFFLLNPLFVEFSFNTVNSYAYVVSMTRPDSAPGNTLSFSNALDVPFKNYHSHTGQPFVWVRFDRAVALGDGPCDTPFNYKEYAPQQRGVTDSNMNSIIQHNNGGLLNMWVFYLDDLTSNFQKTGKFLPITMSNTGAITVFDKNFKTLATDPYQVATYEFMNNIALMYYNFIIPVFTCTFDICVTKDMYSNMDLNYEFVVLKCYMDNGYYAGGNECANNIFAVTLTPNPFNNNSVYVLNILTGDRTGCGYSTPSSPAIQLQLPYLTPNTRTRVTITVGPNQKYAYAEWTDINTGDIGKRFSYSKAMACFANAPYKVCSYDSVNESNIRSVNDFTSMFSSKELNPRPDIANIYLTYNGSGRNFLKNISSFSIGYVNMNNLYAEQ